MRTAFSGALCGEALEFLGLFRKEVLSRVWGGVSKSSPSLRSVRKLGAGRGRYVVALEQRRSRLLAPRQGGGVRLRGAVWLSRSPLHPVCRFAQDDTWGTGAWDGKQNAVSVSFTVLYFTPKKLRTTFHPTHRVILSEAAHRV